MNNHLRHFDCIYKLSLRNTRHRIFNESLIALKKTQQTKDCNFL